MAEVESLEIPRARRREIALAMIEAIRTNAQHAACSNLSPPGALVLLELLDEQKAEVAKVREEASNLAQRLAALEGEGAEDREAEAETDHRTICRLMKDLEEERTWGGRLRAQIEELRAFVPQTRDDANELREQVAQLELAVKHHQDVAEAERNERNAAFIEAGRLSEECTKLEASTAKLVEQARARAFSTERELVDAQQRLQQARADLAAALNDRQLMALRLADMSERFEDLHELVVVIDLGEQIL